MFDTFYGDINGHNIYDESSLDQHDYSYDAEQGNSKGYYKMDQEYYHDYKQDQKMKEEKQEPEPKILQGSITRETDKAFLFKFGESENWMPKSQVKVKKKGDGCSVEIPEWLWKKMTEVAEEND